MTLIHSWNQCPNGEISFAASCSITVETARISVAWRLAQIRLKRREHDFTLSQKSEGEEITQKVALSFFGVVEFETRRMHCVIASCCLAISFPRTSVSQHEQLLVSYYECGTCLAKKTFISVESTAFLNF
jgi:hypothetical protein